MLKKLTVLWYVADVRSWLKSLRLHKYSKFFSQLTYTQMINLTEETFESTVESVGAGPVTVGAQRKILLSIAKLRERYQSLCQLEQVITKIQVQYFFLQ